MIRFGGIRGGTGYFCATVPRAGPGILILHDPLGISASLRALADHLTEKEGLTVLVPHLSAAVDPSPVGVAPPSARLASLLSDAAEHIKLNWHPRLGTVAFSSGAAAGMYLAADLQFEAAVVYYGYAEVDERRWETPLLGHFGGLDDRVPVEEAATVFARLEGAEFALYDDAGHFFANPEVPGAFRQEASECAWNHTIDFLRYHLS